MGTIASVTHGTTMVIIEQFDAAKVLQMVQDEKCTALHGVPTMFIAELNHPDFAEVRFIFVKNWDYGRIHLSN